MIIRADTDLCAMNRGGHPRACVPTSRIPPVKFKLKSASPPLLCVACRVANSKKEKKKRKKGARSPRRGRVRHLVLRSEEIDVPGVRLPSTPGHTQARCCCPRCSHKQVNKHGRQSHRRKINKVSPVCLFRPAHLQSAFLLNGIE